MDAAESPSPLHAAHLQKALVGHLIGRRVIVQKSATSSNDVVLAMARDGAPEGLVLFAEEQTAGRGQRGNRWESGSGQGLWFSILLHPNLEPGESAQLTTWAAQGIATTIRRELSLPATIKEPNDIYIGDRKVAGVLVEMRARPGASHLAIVGIGINLRQTTVDFPLDLQDRAISLSAALSRPVDPQNFATALLRQLDRTYRAGFAL